MNEKSAYERVCIREIEWMVWAFVSHNERQRRDRQIAGVRIDLFELERMTDNNESS